MTKKESISLMEEEKIIAIGRAPRSEKAVKAAKALKDGGQWSTHKEIL